MGSEGKQLLGIRCLMCQRFSGTWEPSITPSSPSTDPMGWQVLALTGDSLEPSRGLLRTWQSWEVQRVPKGKEGEVAAPLHGDTRLAELHSQRSCSHQIPPPSVEG